MRSYYAVVKSGSRKFWPGEVVNNSKVIGRAALRQGGHFSVSVTENFRIRGVKAKMERYLLFDAKCPVCNRLARTIEKEARGRVKVRSLYDREMQAVLNQVRPGWRWEPLLLEIKEERVRVYSGLSMRLRMAIVLGWRRTYRVVQILREAGVGITGVSIERRWFLKQAGLWALGLTLSGLASLGLESTRLAAWAKGKAVEVNGWSPKGPNGVAYEAWKLGVRAYDISPNDQGIVVSFSHVDPAKQGVLSIEDSNGIKKFALAMSTGNVRLPVYSGTKTKVN
ncbi:hypothetical protein [Thermodesulfitimonas sp.]